MKTSDHYLREAIESVGEDDMEFDHKELFDAICSAINRYSIDHREYMNPFTEYTEETILTGTYDVKTNKDRTLRVDFIGELIFSFSGKFKEGEEVISYRKT